MHRLLKPLLLGLLLLPLASLPAQDKKPAAKKKTKEKPDENAMAYAGQYHWADWVEPDFPFFSSVLDAREIGEGFPKDNLTPRGLILNLGHNMWACFDTDLLRIACIWQGEEGKPPVAQTALAPGSYHIAGQKTKDGEEDLPTPIGKVWLSNGLYPGWQPLYIVNGDLHHFAQHPITKDPRTPTPDAEEVGRGPLDTSIGEFKGVQLTVDGPCLNYEVHGIPIREYPGTMFDGAGKVILTRRFIVAAAKEPLMLLWGLEGQERDTPTDTRMSLIGQTDDVQLMDFGMKWDGKLACILKPHDHEVDITLRFGIDSLGKDQPLRTAEHFLTDPAPALWKQTVTTHATLSKKEDAYVVDDTPLPLENPWKRNVRLADIAFLDDQGNAAAIAMDGDVWMISGLKGNLENVTWKRFASGLHEPMSIVAKKDGIYVFDRNGIWRLKDTTGKGEADVYEMFCNRFAQTAETREFPNSMKLAPDGSFIISKGGQQGTYLGKDNGTVIRVSPDGKKYEVLGWGLRQPFVGVHPKTGLVVASDQEGNYVPTTPIQIIKDHQYYGHLATIQPHEVYPQTIADPLTWIPHSVVPSGATLTWLCDAKMGPVNDEMILVSYNKPEIHRVLVSHGSAGLSPSDGQKSEVTGKPQAAVVPWIKNLDFPTLNAHLNPADGQLYAIGFQVWGTTVKRISGLARIRYTGKPRVLLTECTPCDKGVLLHFNLPIDKTAAVNPDNYSVERWNYKRTFNYGSPHLKSDGTPGQEWMVPSSAYLSKDGQSIFVGIPDMKTTYMQMRIGYGLKGPEGLPAQNNAYFTPYELIKFDPEKEGFEKFEVDLTPRKLVAAVQAKPTKEEGERLYQMMGCMACHSIDGTVYGKVGPSWKGLYGSERLLAKGGDRVMADDAYIKESIVNPSAKIVKGYEKLDAGMPIYAGVLNDSQIESLILFIKSLK
jgi:mono/diheme cytochrome c family protein